MKPLTLGAVLFTASSLAHAVPLKPLSQSFQTSNGVSAQGAFHVSKQNVDIIVSGSEGSRLSLSLPDGTAISASNAARAKFTWESVTDQTTGAVSHYISGKSAPLGDYLLALDAGLGDAFLSVFETPSLQFRDFVGAPGFPVQPNKPFSISMLLADGSSPAIGALVTAELTHYPLSQLAS